MTSTLLVLDAHYLCHRAFHSSGHLAWEGKATGVVFGFLKSITTLKDEFQTDRIAFCFEGDNLLRKAIYPEYKSRRGQQLRTPIEKKAYATLGVQIHELHHRHLPKIGFKNIFCYPGFESDDVMAEMARHVPEEEEMIMVTADSDMYQCLRSNVSIYSPQRMKLFTESWFRKEYKIAPHQWAIVKALSGCSTDCVKGIYGVGEITALKYLQGLLSKGDRAYDLIQNNLSKAIVRRNRRLVQLPFAGTPVPVLQEDKVSKQSWLEVCGELGLRSIASRPPLSTRRLIYERQRSH